MQCRVCLTELPEGSRFCFHCGSTVAGLETAARPTVDGFALIKNYIPPELAQRILSAGKQIESERRLVTVLFADVTGFTTLAERTDVEVVSTVLNDCFSGLISIILKYEGTIDKFIGDGIMAIFGAPLAHENDPERAIRCALEMMADIERFNLESVVHIPSPLGLHVGLHSGWVIAGNVGSDLRMNYSVIGDTVNLAARLVELAPRGEIYLTGDTYKLVEGVAVADGPFLTSFKGKATAVNVYKLRGLKDVEESRKEAMGKDELVGREKELAMINAALDRALKRDQARLFIRGEAGVGKTRLKTELIRLAYHRGVASYEGSCSSFETNTPYYLWSSLLRNLLRITAKTGEEEERRRLHQVVHSLALDEHEAYLATLLSLRYDEIMLVDDTVRKARIFQAVRALLNAFSVRRPIAFILEDLHWIDRFSQELLEYIFARTTNVVISLFVLIFRDEYTQARDLIHEGELMDLNRLDRADAAKLIRQCLDADSIPPEIEELALRRSEGNPFFIQEIIKTLLDKKIIAVRRRKVEVLQENVEAGIPGTIQGIIMARIDRLQDSIKEVLFGASVIGREFSRPLLEQVVERRGDIDTDLHELRSLELILEKNQAKEYDYLFKHFLIQEVAYNTILLNKRKDLHASIARAIENIYPDRLMEFYELLAFHYEKAEQWDKAAEYLSRSGHKVRQMYSTEESKNFFERKNAAVKNLYQSVSAKPTLGSTLKAVTPPLIAMLIPILPIFFYIRILGKSHAEDQLLMIIVGVLASLLCIWYVLSLWYLGVVPFLRGRPKMYDLQEDKVRVLYRDGTTLSIDFSEIESLRLVDAKSRAARPFPRKLFDPFGRIAPTTRLTFGLWLREVVLNILPPYSFGFGAGRAEVLVRLNAGYMGLRVFLPWLNSPVRSRELSLVPFDAKEFCAQLEVALRKWRLSRRKR